jgi:tRNA modification GTPase
MFVTKMILESLLSAGARMAEPGEFTKRAFLNGKIDLAQAEAVADVINSSSESAHRASVAQLEGRLSGHIREIRQQLMNAMALLELELDFSGEGLEFIDKSNIINKLDEINKYIVKLLDSYSLGKVYRDGVKVVITGKPNVGKSSLLNALLDQNRAIVTPVPGTTRDVIEENIVLDGILFRLVDTAGIRESSDQVEGIGIQRSAAQLEDAGIVLFVVDGSAQLTDEDSDVFVKISHAAPSASKKVLVLNKTDLGQWQVGLRPKISLEDVVSVSAKNMTGLDSLRSVIVQSVLASPGAPEGSVVVTNARHQAALGLTLSALQSAKNSITAGRGNDLIAIELREAINYLGEIMGEVTSEDVLNNIFGSFCIGK